MKIEESRLLLGSSPMCNARLADATVAARQCSFLISGERGTGKRRFAEELHRDGPFVSCLDAVTLAYVLGLANVRVIVATRGARPIAVAIARRLALPPLRARGVGPIAVEPASPAADPLDEICEKTLMFADARREVVAELERRYVTRALEKAGHNVAKAAANSGIAHRYFQVLKSRRKTG